MLNLHTKMDSKPCNGADKLLRKFIDWSSTKHDTNEFILTHPDLDLQNILVDEDGTVTGLVDWDGVTTVPRSMGYSFPKWIMRDWDLACYQWRYHKPSSRSSQIDISPEESGYYRGVYARFLNEAHLNSGCTERSCSDLARQSVLFASLRRAATRPLSLYNVAFKICDLIGQLTGQGSSPSGPQTVPNDSSERFLLKDDDIEKDSKLQKILGNEILLELQGGSEGSSSELEGSSGDGSSTRATSLNSDCTSTIDVSLITPKHTPPSTLTSSPKQAPSLSVLKEESEEDVIIATPVTAEIVQGVSQQCDAPFPPGSIEQMKGRSRPSKLRTTLKSLQSSLGRRNNIMLRMSGSDNALVAVDNTVSDMAKSKKVCSVPSIVDEGASDAHPYEQQGPLGSTIMAQSPIAQGGSHILGHNNSENDVSEESLPKADQSKIADSDRRIIEEPMRADAEAKPETPYSPPETSPDGSSAPSEEGTSRVSQEPLIHRKRKSNFGRRVVAKLAYPCQTPDVDGSSLPCREIRNDHVPPMRLSRKKRISSWIKSVVRKGRTEDELSVPSSSYMISQPLSATPPRISQNFDFEPLEVNAFHDSAKVAEDEPPSRAHIRKDDTHRTPNQRFVHAGVGACRLQHLEPVSDEVLRSEEFMTIQIFNALADGTLDEARMERLKTGFFTLLDSL